jgi:hypothetical protein
MIVPTVRSQTSFLLPIKMPLKIFFALTKKIVFVQTKTLSAEMMISQEPIKAGSSEEKNASKQKFLFKFIRLRNISEFGFYVVAVIVVVVVVVVVR